MNQERYDFHTHSILSDGMLLPAEMIRYAQVKQHKLIAITDHAEFSNIEYVLGCLKKLPKDLYTDFLIGVELTHVPPRKIAKLAETAKKLGAQIVVVHGETLAEPVPEGTNAAAVNCPDIDILAHPGFITTDEAGLAKENNIFLEISARRTHCLTNGHVAKAALDAGAKLLINTDAHSHDDLITQDFARKISLGAGLSGTEVERILTKNPKEFLKRVE